MNIETKYSVGDVVFSGRAEWGSKPIPCPDCQGSGTWIVVANSDAYWPVTCQTCREWGYTERATGIGTVKQSTRTAKVQEMTIGSVQTDTHEGAHRSGIHYMCIETGVGSGQMWREDALFPAREEAQAFAEAEVSDQLPEARNEDERRRDRLRTEEIHHCTRRDSATGDLKLRTERRPDKKWSAWIPGVAYVEGLASKVKALEALAVECVEL